MNDTPETDAIIRNAAIADHPPTRLAATLTVKCEKLECERDEAREKVEQQRKEIVRLNGSTNHAGGTPLKIVLKERDEARERMADALQEVDLRTLDFERMKEERDEARDKAERYRLEANAMMMQRDEAREALMKIEDLFIDGTDIYADREKMGTIAKEALDGAK